MAPPSRVRPGRSVLGTTALLTAAVLALPLPAASASTSDRAAPERVVRTTDAAHSNPVTVTNKLVLRVNKGQRRLARNWARKKVVTKLFNYRNRGYRLARLHGGCAYENSESAYECGIGLRKGGQVVGSVYLKVQGTSQDLLAVRAVVVRGE